MNKTSTDKIRLATPFLIWFRCYLPPVLQMKVRPYLDSPYQLALKVMDCCNSPQALSVKEIAQSTGVAHETARQILQSLREGGMPFTVSPTKAWQAIQDDAQAISPPSMSYEIDVQEFSEEVMTRQG